MKFKVNDTVVVTAGNDKGKKAKVLRVFPVEERLIVEGVNFIWKHVRRTQQTPAGGRVQKEAPIRANNVLLFCPSCNKGVRTKKVGEKPDRVRACRKCQGQL
jgi:large subunit ribosomal protein L24